MSRINYRALTVIMKEWDMGGENWLMQIRIGFPIMGRIRNAGIYPDVTDLPTNLSRKRNCGRPRHKDGPNWKRSYVKMRIHKLFGTRFKKRLKRDGCPHRSRLRKFLIRISQFRLDVLSFVKRRKFVRLTTTNGRVSMMRPLFIPSYNCRLWIILLKLLGA